MFTEFLVLIETLFDYKIKIFQSNGGTEFDNSSVVELFHKTNIFFHGLCPNTQGRNGVAKRKHCHILEMVASFLIDALVPDYVWLQGTYMLRFIPLICFLLMCCKTKHLMEFYFAECLVILF